MRSLCSNEKNRVSALVDYVNSVSGVMVAHVRPNGTFMYIWKAGVVHEVKTTRKAINSLLAQ